MISLFIKIFLAGIAVLVVAIALNLAASALGLQSWYTFLSQVSTKGISATLQGLRLVDYVFLILIYPTLLGLSAYLVFSFGAK